VRGLSARARIARLAGAAALAAVECGGGEERASAPTEPNGPASAASEPADGPDASPYEALPLPSEVPAAEPAQDFEPSDRAAEVLDIDPEGEGLDELIRIAREDADPSAREAAIVAIGESEASRALDALVAATEDSEPRVVLAAIDQLSWFDDRRAEDAIRRLVDSPNAEIAEAAREELSEDE
jgi:HEAT repeat protein